MGYFGTGHARTYPLNMGFQSAGAAGLIPGVSRVSLLGVNVDVDTADQPEDVWAGASLGVLNAINHKLIQIPSSPVSVEIVSSSAEDSSAGTGLRTAIVTYLDSSYVSKTVTIAMNGTTAVALPESIIAINSVIRGSVGTFRGSNIGNISVRLAGGLGATYAYMTAGRGFSSSSLYTIPAGFSFYIYSMIFSVNRTDTSDRWATFSLNNMSSSGGVLKALETTIGSVLPYRHEAQNMPIAVFTEKSSVWITCEAVSANNTNVTAGFVGLAVRSTILS